jgi:hypothetical protein
MEPTIPTSFIPKRPVSTEPIAPASHNRSVGLLTLVTVVIVVATALSFVGVYLYGQKLKVQNVKLEQSLNTARDGLGSEFITDMKRLSARIDGVKVLLKNHVVVSPIFEALQATTLRSVQYKSFSYGFTNDPVTKAQVVEVTLAGSAKSYSTIALQSDAFAKNPLIRNPVFSGLTIDDKTGRVGFQLKFTVNPSDLSYQTFIDSVNKKVGAPIAPNEPLQ